VTKVFKDPETVLSALADFIVMKANDAIAHNGRFNLALSGGSSPKKLYELLAADLYRNKVDWKKVFFFFGDERYVPLDHADSNYLMAKHSLFQSLGISNEQVYAVNTALSPVQAALDYEQRLQAHFKDPVCRFDLILLGLGDNSHTASLFPHTSVLHETKSLVKEIFVDEVNMHRITFTAPLINAAHHIAFLVYGPSKAEAVHHILEGPDNIEAYPAQLIKPVAGKLIWFIDEAAARKIKSSRLAN
jgi:6-phosphogluconolactonase